MDIDPAVDPTPAVVEPAAPVVTELAAPEATVLEEDVPPKPDHPAASGSSAPPVPPEASLEIVIEKNPVA